MGKHTTKYSSEWMKIFPWVGNCENDKYSAKCSICNCTFSISNAGLSQCRTHSKSKKHIAADGIKSGTSSQLTLTSMSVRNTIGKQVYEKKIIELLTIIIFFQ